MEGFQEYESPEIFCPRADGFSCPPPIRRRALDFLGIFDKMISKKSERLGSGGRCWIRTSGLSP